MARKSKRRRRTIRRKRTRRKIRKGGSWGRKIVRGIGSRGKLRVRRSKVGGGTITTVRIRQHAGGLSDVLGSMRAKPLRGKRVAIRAKLRSGEWISLSGKTDASFAVSVASATIEERYDDEDFSAFEVFEFDA